MILRLSAVTFAVASSILVSLPAYAQRLPTNARPDHYALALSPDIQAATFSGTESIDVILALAAKTITLNAIELQIQSVSANGQQGAVSYDPEKEQATFSFANALPAGHVILKTAFTGILNDKLRGFYLSKTASRNYAVTQFESTDARRAFPSFDEPALKATFDVSLTVDKADTVISNTNLVSDARARDGRHTLTFAPTPKMSTYLLAFLVGDFACTEGKSEGIPIRVCSTPDKVKLTHFALQAAQHFLSYYDTYFGIKYPMPKLDLIAIPDFEAGAMENFGAITYRETDLLVNDDDPVNGRKRVASVVAHEMAHQWFGDMVTMQWWDNLWLNEGFATWMQDKAANDWHPEWGFPQDVALDLNSTLNNDAARTTRTIRARAESPAQIAEMFDGIAYGKAGAVIGMIENWVGPDLFRQGVHNYLAAHLYANATAEDFWNAQTSASHQPVDRVMSSFVDRPGVPVLTFAASQAAGIPVSEKRFFLDPNAGPHPAADKRDEAQLTADSAGWTIPVCIKTTGAPQCQLVGTNTAALVPPPAPFFFANAVGKGYYRVAYSPAQLKAITAGAETSLSVAERIGFVGDRWALMRAGQGSVGEYLDLALALKSDPSSQVLDTTLSSVESIRNRIADDDDRTKLDKVILAQYGPIYTALGPDDQHAASDSFDRQQIRAQLFAALGTAGDPGILVHARDLSAQLFSGSKVNEPDLIDTSVGLSAATGDETFYDNLLTVSQKATDPGLKSESLQLLTQFRKPALVLRTLEYAVSGKVRNQDSWVLIAVELSERENRDIAWPWVQQHWDKVSAQLTTASGANLVSATGSFCTAGQRTQVADFFATHKVEAAERSLSKALDSIDACVRLRETQQPKLRTWLAAHAD